MQVNSPEINKLKILLTKSKEEDRVVAYSAVGKALSIKLAEMFENGSISGKPALNVLIRELVYELNEVIIIDKPLLEKHIINHTSFTLNKTSKQVFIETMYEFTSFNDMLMLNTYFNPNDIALIDKNWEAFKLTLVQTIICIDQFSAFKRD